jgi:uncharacterized membrane protein
LIVIIFVNKYIHACASRTKNTKPHQWKEKPSKSRILIYHCTVWKEITAIILSVHLLFLMLTFILLYTYSNSMLPCYISTSVLFFFFYFILLHGILNSMSIYFIIISNMLSSFLLFFHSSCAYRLVSLMPVWL